MAMMTASRSARVSTACKLRANARSVVNFRRPQQPRALPELAITLADSGATLLSQFGDMSQEMLLGLGAAGT
jgi:hypothetical protein